MPLIQRKLSLAYFVLTLLGLWLLQAVVFAPQSETLTYRDFKTLLQAGKIVDVLMGERSITGRLHNEGLEGLLTQEKVASLQKGGPGPVRFTTVLLNDPTLISDLQAAGVQFQGQIEKPCCPGSSLR